MVKISVMPQKYRIKIQGHAGYGDKGTDILCASVSFAFYNLAQMMLNFYGQGMLCKEPLMKDNEGSSYIEVVPKSEYEPQVQLCFAYFTEGIAALDAQYPEFIKLKVTGK